MRQHSKRNKKINNIMNEEYKSCDNCYYEEFDEYAYPCTMCIRGYTRKDKWQPKRSLSQIKGGEI